MKQILITVAGRNGAGKSLIAKKVAEALGLNVVKSYATRKPRPEELEKGLENCDHIFVSDEEYDKLENITAETEINGARYCTTQEILDNSDIYVIDPKGIKDLKERCGSRYKILQFYIYADADKRAARFVARGETKAKFEAREQSEDEQFCDYENNHGWDIIIYNNWDVDAAVKTMLGYVRPIMTPVIEARQKQAEEGFEKMMNPPAEEKVKDAPIEEQAGMKEQQKDEPKAKGEQTEDAPAEEVPDKETGDEDCQAKAEDEQVEDVSDEETDDSEKQAEEPEEESPDEELQAESEMPAEDGEELEECQQEDASDDSSEVSASTEANDDPFSLDFDDEDEDFMNMPAGVDAEADESDDANVNNDEDSADENNSDAADPFSLDDFDDTDKEDTDSSDEPEKPEEYEEPDDVPEEEAEPVEEPVEESTNEPADENPDNASEIQEEPEESSDDEDDDDDGEAILID